jgi:NADH-quinone oxidoreductase subunit F
MPEPIDIREIDAIVAAIGRGAGDLIPILQKIQQRYHYLPEEALSRVAEVTKIRPVVIRGVATFYDSFRLRPAGRHKVCVCHGTACHVKGSEQVQEAVERHLKLEKGKDTDAAGNYTVERVACVGCCTLAPVVVIDSSTYGHLAATGVAKVFRDFETQAEGGPGSGTDAPQWLPDVPEIRIGVGSCCIAGGSLTLREALERALRKRRIRANIRSVGCVGMCHQIPLVEVVWPGTESDTRALPSALAGSEHAGAGAPAAVFARVRPEEAEQVVNQAFPPQGWFSRAGLAARTALDRLLGPADEADHNRLDVREGQVCSFLGKQVRIATESCGHLDPLDIDAYARHGGFEALQAVMGEMGPDEAVARIQASGLRGRGGAGFPTARKWLAAHAAPGDLKYMVCNGDEGDPGAFMNRMILESYPYRVLEGLAIAARCIGAREGYLYIRAEYPLAVRRVREAIARMEERGLLGEGMCGGRWSLHVQVKEGAGAFVCGEETALLASIEGRRGMPRLRPPYPVEHGLWGKPTVVNNVETLSQVPWILRHGPAEFSKLGTASSKGTKVFALTGKVLRGGLIEVPMGITLREIVEEIGGGVGPGRTLKAVQIGGPSGGCLPAALCHLPVDYEALTGAGAIMGSGGLVVMDDRDCMVDIARYFLRFTQDQSCGQCTFCRVGTRRMLDILDRLCGGKGEPDDLAKLEMLASEVKRGSLCGLGQTAPNPVLTTLRYFREEYEAHAQGRCPAGKCAPLIRYVVTDKCIGCTICAQRCPVNAITPAPYRRHEIDIHKCTRCDVCRQACPSVAIEVRSP